MVTFNSYKNENRRINVFINGSSSRLLSSEYSTVLAGHHIDTEQENSFVPVWKWLLVDEK